MLKLAGHYDPWGKGVQVYTDKSTSCRITYTAELVQKIHQIIEGKEES